MKTINLAVSVLILGGTFGVSTAPVWAKHGVIYRAQSGDFCHLKFPAIREETLSWDQPVLQDASSGDIIDFYGPCDYDPHGKEAVRQQKIERHRQWTREYGG